MDSIFRNCEGVITFIDDILIYGTTIEQLRSRTKKVLEILSSNNLTLNSKKCDYEKEEVIFVGSKISKSGARPTEDKIKLILGFKKPERDADIRSFLGTVQFLGPHLKHLSDMTEPLRKMITQGNKLVWGPEQEKAFEKLKQAVVNVETLAFFDPGSHMETAL